MPTQVKVTRTAKARQLSHTKWENEFSYHSEMFINKMSANRFTFFLVSYATWAVPSPGRMQPLLAIISVYCVNWPKLFLEKDEKHEVFKNSMANLYHKVYAQIFKLLYKNILIF